MNDLDVYRSRVKNVLASVSSREESIKEKEYDLSRLEKEFVDEKTEGFRKPKIAHKISVLKNTMYKDICFGSKKLLREITKLSQEIQCKIEFKTKKVINEQDLIKKQELLDRKHEEFEAKRRVGYYVIGDALREGNRKFDFNLTQGKVVFKPSKGEKFEIELSKIGKGRKKEIERIDFLIRTKNIPLTVTLLDDYIDISYDEELLNGYSFNSKEYRREKAKLDKEDAEGRAALAKKYKIEQENRKLKGKNPNRYMNVDLNPQEIGLVICDKTCEGSVSKIEEKDIIYENVYDLNGLSSKLGKASSNKAQLKQNNKRKHEIKEVWNEIFKLAKHYNVAYFVVEELKFKGVNEKGKEFNRKVKNIWHRTLTMQMIEKNCREMGIILRTVNPVFSSFIGNLVYDKYDCVAAALEICRRGMNKYIKGSSFYPDVKIFPEKLVYLLENKINTDGKWYELYYRITPSGLSYRNKDKSLFLEIPLKSHKSKVIYSKLP